jgi:uncharacterized protein YggE
MKISPVFTLVLFLILNVQNLNAQNSSVVTDESYISISAAGQAYVPADIAHMSINISISDEDAERAFELHRERESFLAGLLQELDFDEDKIRYQPIAIRPNRQRDGDIHSVTSQQIRLELDEIEMLSELQITLIQNGFDNFSGNLSSTKIEDAGDEALRNAVQNARKDAEILALAAGKTLGDVITISHTSDHSFRGAAMAETFQARAMDAGPSMFDFSQMVSAEKRITITFELLRD